MEKEIREILENMVAYCEKQAIYDKLSSHGDFYYKAKKALKKITPEDMPEEFNDIQKSQPGMGDLVSVIMENGIILDVVWMGGDTAPITVMVPIIGWKETE